MPISLSLAFFFHFCGAISFSLYTRSLIGVGPCGSSTLWSFNHFHRRRRFRRHRHNTKHLENHIFFCSLPGISKPQILVFELHLPDFNFRAALRDVNPRVPAISGGFRWAGGGVYVEFSKKSGLFFFGCSLGGNQVYLCRPSPIPSPILSHSPRQHVSTPSCRLLSKTSIALVTLNLSAVTVQRGGETWPSPPPHPRVLKQPLAGNASLAHGDLSCVPPQGGLRAGGAGGGCGRCQARAVSGRGYPSPATPTPPAPAAALALRRPPRGCAGGPTAV